MAANITTEVFAAGSGAILTGDAVVAAVEEILMSEGIGLWQMTARPNQRNGSTFIFKFPKKLISKDYARNTTGASLADEPQVDQLEITTNIEKIVAVEFEEMRFATQEQADAEKARIVNSMLLAVNAHLDLELFDLLAAVNASKPKANTSIAISTKKSQDELAIARIALGQEVAKIESTINDHAVGVMASRMMVLLSPVAYWNYINSFDTNVLQQSEEIKVGNLAIRKINGAIVIKHPFIGKNIADGDIAKGKAVDLSKHDGFIMTDNAVAMPVNFIQTKQRVTNNFTDEIATKYKFGKGYLRPELVLELKNATTR